MYSRRMPERRHAAARPRSDASWFLPVHQLPARPLYLRARIRARLAALKRRFAELGAGDAFGAPVRREIAAALGRLERAPRGSRGTGGPLAGRTWVTRRGLHVDRLACAWFIRRFVDPAARFRFVD